MKRFPRFGSLLPRFGVLALLGLAALLSTAGCHSNADANTASSTPARHRTGQSGDPAAANLAPVSTATTAGTSSSADASGGGVTPDTARHRLLSAGGGAVLRR